MKINRFFQFCFHAVIVQLNLLKSCLFSYVYAKLILLSGMINFRTVHSIRQEVTSRKKKTSKNDRMKCIRGTLVLCCVKLHNNSDYSTFNDSTLAL